MYEHDYRYLAKVVSVTDGDTVRLDINCGLHTWVHNEPVRLYGINAPETRGEERPAGLAAKQWLEERLAPGAEVVVQTYKDDKGKYGRYLADIYAVLDSGRLWHINGALVKAGHAVYAKY